MFVLIVVILLIVCIYLLTKMNTILPEMNNTNAVCLICHKPNDIWLGFLSKFTSYDIYVVVDDNSQQYNSNSQIYTLYKSKMKIV